MTILILLWLACAAFAVWRAAVEFKQITVCDLLLCLLLAPIVAFIMIIDNNTVIWRRK